MMGVRPERDGSAAGTDAAADCGLIFPRVPALVSQHPRGGLELTHVATQETVLVSGRFEEEIRRWLETGTLGAMLEALPSTHPLRRMLDALRESPRLPLTPAAALELEQLDTLFVELTGACTAHCAHCYAEAHGEVDSALSRGCCEAVLRQAAQLGVRRVQLTGGEPLLCDFLPDLVALAAALRVPSCEIFTNGMLLDQPLLARLAPHRPELAFSFYSHDPVVHDGITRTAGSHGATSEAIARCLAQGLEIRVAIIVMADNAAQVDDTRRYLRQLGVRQVSARSSYGVGRGQRFAGAFSADDEPAEDDGRCRASGGKLCVSHDGTVYPCIFNRSTPLGRVPDQALSEILAQPALPTADELPEEDFIRQTAEQLACIECRLTALALRRLARID